MTNDDLVVRAVRYVIVMFIHLTYPLNYELRITNYDFVCLCIIPFVVSPNNLPLNPIKGTFTPSEQRT
jgi:hypothetical protein